MDTRLLEIVGGAGVVLEVRGITQRTRDNADRARLDAAAFQRSDRFTRRLVARKDSRDRRRSRLPIVHSRHVGTL